MFRYLNSSWFQRTQMCRTKYRTAPSVFNPSAKKSGRTTGIDSAHGGRAFGRGACRGRLKMKSQSHRLQSRDKDKKSSNLKSKAGKRVENKPWLNVNPGGNRKRGPAPERKVEGGLKTRDVEGGLGRFG
ncbi:hypothetical protein NE237_019577 [Protea cynaroides]|uniref:Uncharacterized protein n=1 Tax=Protea cynaroides TaxID=273540 RepID=A0A9Q0H8Z0_9MAGN|nr:hypothetical protein NE237_019577 [Protea cynaroides]